MHAASAPRIPRARALCQGRRRGRGKARAKEATGHLDLVAPARGSYRERTGMHGKMVFRWRVGAQYSQSTVYRREGRDGRWRMRNGKSPARNSSLHHSGDTQHKKKGP